MKTISILLILLTGCYLHKERSPIICENNPEVYFSAEELDKFYKLTDTYFMGVTFRGCQIIVTPKVSLPEGNIGLYTFSVKASHLRTEKHLFYKGRDLFFPVRKIEKDSLQRVQDEIENEDLDPVFRSKLLEFITKWINE